MLCCAGTGVKGENFEVPSHKNFMDLYLTDMPEKNFLRLFLDRTSLRAPTDNDDIGNNMPFVEVLSIRHGFTYATTRVL